MNYKIITDEKVLRDFIDNVLPDLEAHEKYYFCLFARNKYCKDIAHISSDKAQLKRGSSDKARLFEKIKQLEVELGCYTSKGKVVPQEALALYITPNPRNMFKATVNTMVKLAQSIRDENVMMNPHQEAMSEIQKAKSRTAYVDFDMDYKPDLTIDSSLTEQMKFMHFVDNLRMHLYGFMGATADFKILETRGGFHILVKPDSVEPQFKNTWYKNIKSLPHIDQTGDQMIPVPGTYQGGFTPNFV